MGVAEDLLLLAHHLAAPGPNDPAQVWLRRSVSTAYYALFHLLVSEAAEGWSGSPALRLRLERAFQHRNMKQISETVMHGSWKGWSTPPPPLPVELRQVATAFVKLQEVRHLADYDNSQSWTLTDAQRQIEIAENAFQNWRKIRTDPAANEYLLSLLIGRKRE